MHYIDLLEISHEYDVAVARANSKYENRQDRLFRSAFRLSDKQFIKRFRLSKDLTRELMSELSPHMPPTLRSDALDVPTKVLIALKFYASGSYQTDIGDSRRLCVSQASVSKVVNQVTRALNKPSIINKYVVFPFRQQDREQIKREFYMHFRMPGLLACIDGTHVAIVRPKENEERYFCRKNYHSLNVMILCDSNLNILCVDNSYPGSTHDSVVWVQHPICSFIERQHISGEDIYILGDSGYPLRPTLMIPVSDPDPDTPEAYYQELHLSARNVVERCIGVLKGRFRCLLVDRKLHYAPKVAARIINACCVLHNIANRAQVPFTPLTVEEAARERELTRNASGPGRPGQAARRARSTLRDLDLGHARREALIRRLWADRRIQI